MAAARYKRSEPESFARTPSGRRTGLGSSFETCPVPQGCCAKRSRRISIKDLIETIARLTGFDGRIWWDVSQPNGQPRRKLDVSRAEIDFGFRSKVSFEEGLRWTIEWYQANRESIQLPVTELQM